MGVYEILVGMKFSLWIYVGRKSKKHFFNKKYTFKLVQILTDLRKQMWSF